MERHGRVEARDRQRKHNLVKMTGTELTARL
jgi:hypothetical protein